MRLEGPRSRRSWRERAPLRGEWLRDTRTSQRALDGFDLETLDHIALLHVLVIGEGHAAFLTVLDFAHFILEALEGRKFAFMDHHIVADQPHLGAAAHTAFGDAAARDLAHLG